MSHYTDSYIVNPNHQISVNLIGCGGTGSYVLTKLALLHNALKQLRHPGLSVRAWDPDLVSPNNCARQLFHNSDVGKSKAEVLIDRINYNFGLKWNSFRARYDNKISKFYWANIFISCVDNVEARRDIHANITRGHRRHNEYERPYYWFDCGNDFQFGQVIMGTLFGPKKKRLKNVFDVHPELEEYIDNDIHPSCSMAESLNRQDLFVNSIIADLCMHMVWSLFRRAKLDYHGVYINLETMELNKLPV